MRRVKRRDRSVAPIADHGPPERARHGEVVPRPTAMPSVTGRRVKFDCRLDWYLDKCSIHDRQYAAGLRFRRDWLIATAAPHLVTRYQMRFSGRQDFTETQIAARRRLAKAVAALGHPLARIVIDVCCIDAWAAERLPLLRDALTRLADHYGLPSAAPP